jgi:hypothetical protein
VPSRIVREGILTSERVDRIADEPAAEVFYRRLHSVVDDYGRFSAHPSLVRAALYPLRLDKITDEDVSGYLAACASAGLIRLYRVDGKAYLEVLNFRQKTRAKRSKYPAPEGQMPNTCGADDQHVTDICGARAGHLRTESESESETETETETETEACADGALPLDEFFEERYARHPRKRDRTLAEQAMSGVSGVDTAQVQDEFRRGHEAWIVTDDYTWKGGAKCPTFAEFITDRTWKYLPSPKTGGDDGAHDVIEQALKLMRRPDRGGHDL